MQECMKMDLADRFAVCNQIGGIGMCFQKKDPSQFQGNPFTMIGNQWYLLTAGTPEHYKTMTASWGAMGVIWGAPSFQCVVRTNRYTYQFMEEQELFSICFFPESNKPALQFCGSHSGRDCDKAAETGLTPIELDGTTAFEEAELVFICKKRYACMMEQDAFTDPAVYSRWYEKDPMHKQYVGEILAVYEKTEKKDAE